MTNQGCPPRSMPHTCTEETPPSLDQVAGREADISGFECLLRPWGACLTFLSSIPSCVKREVGCTALGAVAGTSEMDIRGYRMEIKPSAEHLAHSRFSLGLHSLLCREGTFHNFSVKPMKG